MAIRQLGHIPKVATIVVLAAGAVLFSLLIVKASDEAPLRRTPLISPLASPLKAVSSNTGSGITVTAEIGDVVTYTLRLRGTGNAGPANLTDTLPAGVSIIPNSVKSNGGSYSIVGNTLYWQGTVAATQPITIVFSARLADTLLPGQQITNVARASNPVMPIVATNAVTVTIQRPPLQSVSKWVLGLRHNHSPFGGKLFYTILITSPGNSRTVYFTDALPSGVTPMRGAWVSSGEWPRIAGNTVYWSGDVRSTRPIMIFIPVKIRHDLPRGAQLVNVAHTSSLAGLANSNVVTTTLELPHIHPHRLISPSVVRSSSARLVSTLVLTAEEGAGPTTITNTLPAGALYVPGSVQVMPSDAGVAGFDAQKKAITATVLVDADQPVTITWQLKPAQMPMVRTVITDATTVFTGAAPFLSNAVSVTFDPYRLLLPIVRKR